MIVPVILTMMGSTVQPVASSNTLLTIQREQNQNSLSSGENPSSEKLHPKTVNHTLILSLRGDSTQMLVEGSEPTSKSLQTTQVQTINLSQIPNPITSPTLEQQIPNFPKPQQEPLTQPTDTTNTPKTENVPEISVRVEKFEFEGEPKAFTQQEYLKAVKDFTGKEITFAKLLEAEDAIRALYIQGCNKNSSDDKPCYINSYVFIPTGQNINQQHGVVKIRIIEGSIEDIKITGTSRLNPDYVSTRLAPAIKKPFNQKSLLAALQILEQNPLIDKISAVIVAFQTPY